VQGNERGERDAEELTGRVFESLEIHDNAGEDERERSEAVAIPVMQEIHVVNDISFEKSKRRILSNSVDGSTNKQQIKSKEKI
jgi:hypothetical protein